MSRTLTRDIKASLNFNGSATQIDYGNLSELNFGAGQDFSIFARFKKAVTGQMTLCDKGARSGVEAGWRFACASSNAFGLELGDGTSRSAFNIGSAIVSPGVWHSGVVTCARASNATGYLDNINLGTVSISAFNASDLTNTVDFTVGAIANNAYFNGSIQEVYIFNRVLTAQEIANLHYLGQLPTDSATSRMFGTNLNGNATDISANPGTPTITAGLYTKDTYTKKRILSNNPNLVYNPDFEFAPVFTAATTSAGNWIDGTAAGNATQDVFGWGLILLTGTGSAQFDPAQQHSGLNSLRVSTLATGSLASAGTIGSNVAAQTIAYGIKVAPNTVYSYSFWMKTNYVSGDSNDGAYVSLVENLIGGGTNLTNVTTKIKTTTGWTQYTGTITTNAATSFIHLRGNVVGNTGTATLIMDAWFDDFSFVPLFPINRTLYNANLIKNGNFEIAPPFTAATTTANRYIDGTASGSATNGTWVWAILNGTVAGTYSAQFDTSISHSGNNSMHLSIGATGSVIDFANVPITTSANLAIPVIPGVSYTFTGWMMTTLTSGSATTGARFEVEEFDAVGGNAVAHVSSSVLTTTGWTRYTITFTAATATRFVVIRGSLKGNDGAGTLIMDAWFDDLVLMPTTPPVRTIAAARTAA